MYCGAFLCYENILLFFVGYVYNRNGTSSDNGGVFPPKGGERICLKSVRFFY